jgi:hypothetical protein
MKGDSLRTLEVKPGDKNTAARWNSLVRRVANNSFETAPGRRAAAAAASRLPFQVYQSAALKVKVTAGRLCWHNKDFDLFTATEPEITISTSASSFKIWLSLDSVTAPTTATASGSTGGWSGYPAQPNIPARTHLLLAVVTSDTTQITGIDLFWNGGDIIWPGTFGLWA